jgi:hypothetical protein
MPEVEAEAEVHNGMINEGKSVSSHGSVSQTSRRKPSQSLHDSYQSAEW